MGGSIYIQQKFSESFYALREIGVFLIYQNDFRLYRAVGDLKAVGTFRAD